jgi:hypothetical protein
MARRSNKSIGEILTPPPRSPVPRSTINASSHPKNNYSDDLLLLERKITIATEGFTTAKFCELILKDRQRLSKENALTICEYVIAMKREVIQD